jgi:glutathione S-transferase
MITLYGSPYSSNARKVHWLLEETGATYRYESIDLFAGQQKSPDYLRMNPNGRVPTIDDDGFILWESNAILWYLADKLGRGKVVPEDVRTRAHVDQWMWWQASDLQPATSRVAILKIRATPEQPIDPVKHKEAVEGTAKPLKILDEHITEGGRKYVVGDAFSIADISLAEATLNGRWAGVSLDGYPAVSAWLARLSERPAFQRTRPQSR